jgi:hypothetical protein
MSLTTKDVMARFPYVLDLDGSEVADEKLELSGGGDSDGNFKLKFVLGNARAGIGGSSLTLGREDGGRSESEPGAEKVVKDVLVFARTLNFGAS